MFRIALYYVIICTFVVYGIVETTLFAIGGLWA